MPPIEEDGAVLVPPVPLPPPWPRLPLPLLLATAVRGKMSVEYKGFFDKDPRKNSYGFGIAMEKKANGSEDGVADIR